MADFHQPRYVTTLHALGPAGHADALRLLMSRARTDDIATTLVLPALAQELDGVAFPRILRRLSSSQAVSRVIVVLGHATPGQQAAAERLLSSMHVPVTLVRLDDPALPRLGRQLRRAGVEITPEGKGYACWVGLCTALAAGADVVALHDCDIESYEPALIARLVAPLVLPEVPFDFAKGYYPRVTSRMYGRVTRLFVAPLLHALESLGLPTTLPAFMAEFRYPLAGEVAFSRRLASEMPLHAGWGLEVGTLAEIYRRQSRFRVCQVDVADGYEHRHRCIEPDVDSAVHTMVTQILTTIVDALRREGVCLDARLLRYVLIHYRQEARRLVAAYEADAVVNGLTHDRASEEQIVDGFASVFEHVIDNGAGATAVPLPSWSAVCSATPDAALAFADIAAASEIVATDAGLVVEELHQLEPAS